MVGVFQQHERVRLIRTIAMFLDETSGARIPMPVLVRMGVIVQVIMRVVDSDYYVIAASNNEGDFFAIVYGDVIEHLT
jgi:hypothetical protein